jgi:DMSO/TMAO reductase YedYZ molybdopterin-dependent catalytic subunit
MNKYHLTLIRGLTCFPCALALQGTPAVGQITQPALVVRGAVEQPLSLALTNLLAMPRVKVTAQEKDGSQVTFEGVALYELLRQAKPRLTDKCCSNAVNTVVIVRAADSYQSLFSLPELDPKFTARQILVADRREGQPLNQSQGPLQIVVPDEKVHARWVRQVTVIEVLPLGDRAGISTRPAPR